MISFYLCFIELQAPPHSKLGPESASQRGQEPFLRLSTNALRAAAMLREQQGQLPLPSGG